uniref:GREB1 N-terminal domain-containing protein n=1 Tax=Ciona savignyi TaxID=51511 RepID=H2ZDS6_CIOSA
MSVEALMRSKNLLPVQVIPTVPSSLMGNSQSGQKAAFEEALHSSIENSLRSVAVAPSSVFSTLFLTLRPVPAVHKDDVTDVKPNSEQLAEELNKQTVNRQDVSSDMQNNLLLSKFSFVNRTSVENIVSSPHSTSESGSLVQPTVCQPPALIPASHVRHKASSTTLPPVPRPPITLISQQQQQQQQQLEQARVEQLKQMQRLHAWKHMQKDQPRPLLSGLDISASNILPANLSTSLAGSSMSTESSLPVSMPTNPINGMYSNGNFHGVRATGNTQLKGLCKSGKDIRLCTLENDCSQMFTCPSEHVLLALQLTRTTVESNSLIVISINLKSLPPPNSSSQALSIQCVGCGEKAIHTFAQLVDHVGLERSDLGSHPVNSNSGQLIGSYARFYLVRDRKNPRHLIRGPALMWNKQMEAGRLRVGVPVPRFSMMQNPLFRNPGPILPSPSHFSTPREGGNSHHPL